MFGLGTPELIVILAIAFFIFGGKKLPELGSGIGKALGSFRKGLADVEDAGGDLTRNLPVVKEVSEVKDKIDKARKVTGILGK